MTPVRTRLNRANAFELRSKTCAMSASRFLVRSSSSMGRGVCTDIVQALCVCRNSDQYSNFTVASETPEERPSSIEYVEGVRLGRPRYSSFKKFVKGNRCRFEIGCRFGSPEPGGKERENLFVAFLAPIFKQDGQDIGGAAHCCGCCQIFLNASIFGQYATDYRSLPGRGGVEEMMYRGLHVPSPSL
jgi:hypothetical protein